MNKDIIAKAVEYIEKLPNNEKISTAQVLERVGVENVDIVEGITYHSEICDEIRKRGIVSLDMSEYEDKDVGLPYNIPYIVRKF